MKDKKIRLSERVFNKLLEAFNSLSGYKGVEIYLFGSRTKGNVRGGDIDLLVVVPGDWNSSKRFKLKLDLLREIYKRLGEQKVDVVIVSPNGELYKEVIGDSVKLWSY